MTATATELETVTQAAPPTALVSVHADYIEVYRNGETAETYRAEGYTRESGRHILYRILGFAIQSVRPIDGTAVMVELLTADLHYFTLLGDEIGEVLVIRELPLIEMTPRRRYTHLLDWSEIEGERGLLRIPYIAGDTAVNILIEGTEYAGRRLLLEVGPLAIELFAGEISKAQMTWAKLQHARIQAEILMIYRAEWDNHQRFHLCELTRQVADQARQLAEMEGELADLDLGRAFAIEKPSDSPVCPACQSELFGTAERVPAVAYLHYDEAAHIFRHTGREESLEGQSTAMTPDGHVILVCVSCGAHWPTTIEIE